jgi:hypothetical protein
MNEFYAPGEAHCEYQRSANQTRKLKRRFCETSPTNHLVSVSLLSGVGKFCGQSILIQACLGSFRSKPRGPFNWRSQARCLIECPTTKRGTHASRGLIHTQQFTRLVCRLIGIRSGLQIRSQRVRDKAWYPHSPDFSTSATQNRHQDFADALSYLHGTDTRPASTPLHRKVVVAR